jgi:hypothetical protein
MPCGLLYSALMLAGLANSALEGALAMAVFAMASTSSLVLGPWAWGWLQRGFGPQSQQWATRVSGVLLLLVALQSLRIDLQHQIELWCR